MQKLANFSSRNLCFYEKLVHKYSQAKFDLSKDYYKTLECTRLASESQIKTQFYKLAKKYHPDVYKGNDNRFKEINEAYEILGDNQQRKQYDDNTQPTSEYTNTAHHYQKHQSTDQDKQSYKYHFANHQFKNQQEFEHYKQQILNRVKEQQQRAEQSMNQQQYHQQQYQSNIHLNSDHHANRSADSIDSFMKAAYQQWQMQMQDQNKVDEEYNRVFRQKDEEYIREVQHKVKNATSFFYNKFGSTVDYYKEMNRNIDQNVSRLKTYFKK